MHAPGLRTRPCYSLRLVRPFLAVLRESQSVPDELLDQIEQLELEERLPITVVHDMLQIGTDLARDPDLGLKAAARLTLGDAGAVDYLWSSGATLRDSLEALARSIRLVNDALSVHVQTDDDAARVVIESRVPLPRVAADFMLAALFKQHFHDWLETALPSTRVCFAHPEPDSLTEYERAFAPASLRFAQPFVGFAFPRSYLEAPLPSADPRLHEVMRSHTEALLAELPRPELLIDQVKRLIAEELCDGNPRALNIASRLGMTERTLARRLEREGVTFKTLLDDSRRDLALRLVERGNVELSEVTRRVGFSNASAFYRAFRRWTGGTPLQHRARELEETRPRRA